MNRCLQGQGLVQPSSLLIYHICDLEVLDSPGDLEDHQHLHYQEDLENLNDLWDLMGRAHLIETNRFRVIIIEDFSSQLELNLT